MIKMREIVNMTKPEIERRLVEAESELSNLRFQLATHQLDNPKRVTIVRRDVARLRTVLKEIDLGIRKPLAETEGGTNE